MPVAHLCRRRDVVAVLTYRVYLWVTEAALEPEVVEVVQAVSPEMALLVAMERHELTAVSAVRVVVSDGGTLVAWAEGAVVFTDGDLSSEWFEVRDGGVVW